MHSLSIDPQNSLHNSREFTCIEFSGPKPCSTVVTGHKLRGNLTFFRRHNHTVAKSNDRESRYFSTFQLNEIDTIRPVRNTWKNPNYNTCGKSDDLISIDALLIELQNCIRSKIHNHAVSIYLQACSYGLESNQKVVNYIIPMFVECGDAIFALTVINKSFHCNEYSWTSLIQGFIESGNLQHAFTLYQDMQERCVCPSGYTFIVLLKGCGRLRCLEGGHKLHIDIVKTGLETDVFLGNTLVGMYGKCGALLDSEKVFEVLLVKDIISWNALIAGYSEAGLDDKALDCVHNMQIEGVCPDCVSYISSIKACGNRGSILKGQILHKEIVIRGIEKDNTISNILVDMYVKCGAIKEAHHLFNKIPARDTISWNILMMGYTEHGLFEEVLNLSDQMRDNGISQDASTYVTILKACRVLGAKTGGQRIHIDIVRRGYENDDYIGSSLVTMYTKCNLLAEACEVFDGLAVRDLICWTALVTGYTECGFAEDAVVCFHEMQLDGVSPCPVLFSCTLKACSSIEDLITGQELHAEVVKSGFERDSFIGSAMVEMYAKCGSLSDARYVFDNASVKDTVLWTSLISGYAEHGFGEEALKCLKCMELGGVSPDAVVLACTLKACGILSDIDIGREIHFKLLIHGFEREGIVSSSLIDMYAKCGYLADAQKIFDQQTKQDLVSWNAIIAGYANHGFTDEARHILEDMQLKGVPLDLISWNSVVSGYAEDGDSVNAFECFAKMQEQGFAPDGAIFLSMLKTCGGASSLDAGRRIHAQNYNANGQLVSNGVDLSTIVIEMYSLCGDMVGAQELFDSTTIRHVRIWDALIRGYARQMKFDVVFELLKIMNSERIKPDEIMVLNFLNVCSHLGLADEAEIFFETMVQDFGIVPNIKHHTCIVDLLGRAGRLDEAAVMIKKLPLQPNLIVWCILLDACRKWKNVELGKWAFQHAMNVEEKNSAPFILMSSIYADAGMHDAAKALEALRTKMYGTR